MLFFSFGFGNKENCISEESESESGLHRLGVFHSHDLSNPDSTDQRIRSKEPDLTDPDHDLSDLMKRWI